MSFCSVSEIDDLLLQNSAAISFCFSHGHSPGASANLTVWGGKEDVYSDLKCTLSQLQDHFGPLIAVRQGVADHIK